MLSTLGFIFLALIILIAAGNCVSSKKVIHGAYWLLVAAIGTAGMTWMLGAEYIAVTQLLVYAGAVGILTVFTVMVTARSHASASREVKLSWSALILTLGFFALIAYGIIQTPGLADFVSANEPVALEYFGAYLFDIDGHAFAFEIASLVLLVALVAAVWWTKDRDDTETEDDTEAKSDNGAEDLEAVDSEEGGQ
jgi:NADH-quinone oxidoreductase subunit J